MTEPGPPADEERLFPNSEKWGDGRGGRLAGHCEVCVAQHNAVRDPRTSEETLLRLAKDGYEQTREYMAGEIAQFPFAEEILSRDHHPSVLSALAGNSKNPDVLWRLARKEGDYYCIVRLCLCWNWAVTLDLCSFLAEDPHVKIRQAAFRMMMAKRLEECGARLGWEDEDTLLLLGWHTTNAEILRGLALHKKYRVRRAVVQNAATPKEALIWLAEDWDEATRESALKTLGRQAVAEHKNKGGGTKCR